MFLRIGSLTGWLGGGDADQSCDETSVAKETAQRVQSVRPPSRIYRSRYALAFSRVGVGCQKPANRQPA